MSAVAGRILIIPKGTYVAGTTYNMLDLVKYNAKSFLAKRTNTNVTPVDGADWMELTNDGVTSFNGRTGAVSPANGDYNMTNLGDVNLTTPTDGQGLRYNAQSGKWENGDAASAVSNLTDVDLTSLANGQILKYNSTAQKWENVDEKGHTIQNASGTAQTQRANLQYKDAFVSDDSTNGRTVVENIKEHTTKADYDNATEDGFHVIDDGNDVPIGTPSVDYVEVVGDGVKTWSQLINDLYALVDSDKLTDYSIIEYDTGTFVYYYPISYKTNGQYDFTMTHLSWDGKYAFNKISVKSSASIFVQNVNGTITDISSSLSTNGVKLNLYYGTSSTVINLKTDANYCQMGDGTTVQSKIESNDFDTFGTLASFESAIKNKLALMKKGDIARGVVMFSSSFAPFNLAGGFSFFIQSRADNNSNVGIVQVWNQLGYIHYGFCNSGAFTWKKPTLT